MHTIFIYASCVALRYKSLVFSFLGCATYIHTYLRYLLLTVCTSPCICVRNFIHTPKMPNPK